MTVARLLVAPLQSSVVSRLRSDARFLVVEPRVRTKDSRGVAASFFGPMADHLEQADRRVLVLPPWPDDLPLAFRRMLDRTALTLGVLPPDSACYDLRRQFDAPPVLPGPGAGRFAPGGVLLVGERPNVAKSGELKHRLPFINFYGGGCAPWFTERLEEFGLPESSLYWINAYDAVGASTEHSFVSRLQPARIWALGKLAERWCNDNDLEYEGLPHPQYWKRFHHHQPYPFPRSEVNAAIR